LEHWSIQNFLERMGAKSTGCNTASRQNGANRQESLSG
jgi:hypothetical protein